MGWVLNVPGGAAVQAGDPKAAVVEYIAAFNAYDVNRWKATLHPDVLKNITAKNEEDLKDAFAIASFLEIKYEIVDLQVLQQTNDTAVVAYTIKGSSGLDPNTPPETFTGKFLLMKYQGQWKIYFQSFTDAETIK